MNKVTNNHFTEIFGITDTESQIDFFDINLDYDSRLFVDPFLLKRSLIAEERELYKRFYIYFSEAIRRASEVIRGKRTKKYLYNFLYFKEPSEVCLGYTETSHSGSGLGGTFAKSLTAFFLTGLSHRIIGSTNYENSFNPEVFAIFTEGVAQDGISDLTVNLIMDYLVTYTQKICNKYSIQLVELRVNNTFDYDEKEWTHGQSFMLPENPLKPGSPVILVPKRLLRGSNINSNTVVTQAIRVLRTDPILKDRFSDLIQKPIKDISVDVIKQALSQESTLLRRFIEIYSLKGDREAYDFKRDPLEFLSLKTYSHYFKNWKYSDEPNTSKALYDLAMEFIVLFKQEHEVKDGWKDAWVKDERNGLTEITEPSWGRKFRGMGTAFFKHYPSITFGAEFGTGNGFLDFILIYKSFKITIELKKLSNNSKKGPDKIPSYIHGLTHQLPIYTKLASAQYAIYITGQHRSTHTPRIMEIQSYVSQVNTELLQEIPGFQTTAYINIDLTSKPSSSKA